MLLLSTFCLAWKLETENADELVYEEGMIMKIPITSVVVLPFQIECVAS